VKRNEVRFPRGRDEEKNQFELEMEHFSERIVKIEDFRVQVRIGLRDHRHRIMEAIYKSPSRGREVKLS
jgi:predicted dehydrogenase